MPWATNPLFEPKQRAQNLATDVEAAPGDGGHHGETGTGSGSGSASPEPKDNDQLKFRPPSDHFTPHQIFYIFVLDGIVSAIFAGGINFAIAYALYHDKGTRQSPIRLFQFPNTLAGDTAVTIFIQFLTTWIIEAILVNYDLKKGGVQPIGFIPEPRWKYVRWFMFLDRHEQTDEVRSINHWLRFLFSQIIRSLVLAVIFFPFIFGVSVGILTIVGKHNNSDWDWYYSATWAPEIFKLVQGAVLGLLFTPPMVMFWLARCGWALQSREGTVE
ncbi:putative glycoside hydrolase family 43 protein [Rosellinia necatrix]|uniref:Putative glycoside hydrolase family 43 protein n=1 Tax=Rosellinia necatrix TaxID=77044 RepID=A0A1W2TJN6_ROSNE|nr:putative glycoside hydrolase family 43 protein [Rosellinia necatrix]